MMPSRAGMTRWYSVPRLAAIGVRVAISTVFGEFADRRSSLATERPLDPEAIDPAFTYAAAEDEDFWLDYVADNGDGWDSTFAIARLLAAPYLEPAGNTAGPLPRARVLVMGGDQVYPTPSREAYREKLIAPYREASRQDDWPAARPDLYAVPGNHDWYDGLSAFLNLFCWRQLAGPWSTPHPGNLIGGWRTQQTRSYFALKLPRGWWLWGTDIQLTSYIDQQQIDYFEHAARHWMPANARLILCAGVPDWVYVDPARPEATFSHFSFIEGLLSRVGRGQRLCVILTGDSHHYSRYTEDDRHYITAGGGGAFLHPTHQLPLRKSFDWNWPRPNATTGPPPPALPPGQESPVKHQRDFRIGTLPSGEPAVFPSRGKSIALSLKNLAFAGYNWDFAAALGVICAIFAWQLDGIARSQGSTLPLALAMPSDFTSSIWSYLGLVIATPWPLLMLLAAAASYCYFADFTTWPARIFAGVLHTIAQTVPVVLLTIVLARSVPLADTSFVLVGLVGLLGGIVAATVMGLYLLACLTVGWRHWNEAFSGLRIRDYKNFLRMRIDAQGQLTIYPVGLTDVPSDQQIPPARPELLPHLVEPPIVIA